MNKQIRKYNKLIMVLLLTLSMIIGIREVRGELSSLTGGGSGGTGLSISGDYNAVNGIRIVILDSNGKRKKGTHVADILNPPTEWLNTNQYYVLNGRLSLVEYSIKNKNGEKHGINWETKVNGGATLNNENYVYSVSDSPCSGCGKPENFHEYVQAGKICWNKYGGGNNFSCSIRGGVRYNSLNDYLISNDYQNLKRLVNYTGLKFDELNSDDYISVEVLFQVMQGGKRCVGTGFEIAKAFKISAGAQTRYKNTAKLVFLDKNKIENFNSVKAVDKSEVLNYNYEDAYNKLKDVNVGVGFGLFKVSNLNRNNEVKIIKRFKNDDDPTGITFTIESGNIKKDCTIKNSYIEDENKYGSCTIVLDKGETNRTYVLTETKNGEPVNKAEKEQLSDCYYSNVFDTSNGVKCNNINKNSAEFKVGENQNVYVNLVNETDDIALKIIKTNQDNIVIEGKKVEFAIYYGESCKKENYFGKQNSYNGHFFFKFKGEEIDELSKYGNIVSIRETIKPDGYELSSSSECVVDSLEINSKETVKYIKNYQNDKDSCINEFNKLINTQSMVERYNIYINYPDTSIGRPYENLLNLDKVYGEDACTHNDPPKPDSDCLKVSSNSDGFTNRNLSQYTDELLLGTNTVGFCQSSANISSDVGSGPFESERGLPLIKTLNPITAEIKYKCFLIDETSFDSSKSYSIKGLDDFELTLSLKYLGKETINQTAASSNLNDNKSDVYDGNNGLVITKTYNYNFKPIYVEIGSGIYHSSPCKDKECNSKFYGVLSNPADKNKSGTMKFSYSLKNGIQKINYSGEKNCPYSLKSRLYPPSYSCEYYDGNYYDRDGNVVNERQYKLSCDKTRKSSLNVEFRTIDTSNPFPGKSGNNNRKIGTNWRGYCFNPDKTGKCDMEANKTIMEYAEKYDNWSKTGKITQDTYSKLSDDNLDAYAKYALSAAVGNNSLSKIYIENATNSYGQKKDSSGQIEYKDPIYTITLTPSDIKKIRTYNSYTTYDDYISMNKQKCDIDQPDSCGTEYSFKMKFVDGLIKGTLKFKGKSDITLSNKLSVTK